MAGKEKELNKRIDELEKALTAYDALAAEHDEASKQIVVLTGQRDEIQKELDQAIAKIDELTMALMGAEQISGTVLVGSDEPELTEADLELIAAACNAYHIEDKFVFKARIEDGAAVVITAGGARVKYHAGDEEAEDFVPLSFVQVTGINPNAKKRKPIAGKDRR